MRRRQSAKQDETSSSKLNVAYLLTADKAPYYTDALWRLTPVEVEKIRQAVPMGAGMGVREMDTFAVTERGVLLYTPGAVAKWTERQIAFVLAHEVLHVVLLHPQRSRQCNYDPRVFNIACDIWINNVLREGGWSDWPPTECWPETWGFPVGLTADEYYVLLIQKRNEQREKKSQRGDAGQCPQCGSSDDHSQGCPNEDQGHIDGEPDVSELGTGEDAFGACGSGAGNPVDNENDLGDEVRAAERDPDEMEEIAHQVISAIAEAERRNPGSVPGGLARWVEKAQGPAKVHWRTQLRQCARGLVHQARRGRNRRTYRKSSRRQAYYGWRKDSILLAGKEKFAPDVMLVVDTSASMGGERLSVGLREADALFRSLGAKVRVMSCDAEVHGVRACRSWEEAADALKGGGGTSFHPIFDHIRNEKKKPDLVVIVTDGWGPAPAAAPTGTDVIWLEVGTGATAPCDWGTHIRVET